MPTTAHAGLLAAIEQMVRAQRETGAFLSRAVDCPRGGLSIVRVLEHGARQIGDLAHELRVDVSVASRHVAGLVDAGLVERDVVATDRRVRTVDLTKAGRTLAARHAATAQELADQVFADWSPEEVDAAAEQFRKVADAIVGLHQHLAADHLSTPHALHAAAPQSPEREIA